MPDAEIGGSQLKKIIFVAAMVGLLCEIGLAQELTNNNQSASASSVMRRSYPGGRDESDLTVQPHKRITKREAQGDESEGEVQEMDPVGDSEDFGE